ncbi:MAG: hypothetical protein K8R88_13150 [Armatimonadetes bacterium]|nr:hypothetical protein [Armatimonadota bacterium]
MPKGRRRLIGMRPQKLSPGVHKVAQTQEVAQTDSVGVAEGSQGVEDPWESSELNPDPG